MQKLLFEKVGDIHSTYPYLCVYLPGGNEPFMEVAITEAREIELTFYPHMDSLALGIPQMQEILDKARSFLPQALENEDNSGMTP